MSGLFDVSKEIILITGASQGLGRQFARVLSAHGAAVVLAARQTAKLKSLEEEIRAKGGRATAVQMDVTDIASIGSLISGLAVLISLVYLSLQVRQAELNQRAVVNQGLIGRMVDNVSTSSTRSSPTCTSRP